jgi:hypothetical protein
VLSVRTVNGACAAKDAGNTAATLARQTSRVTDTVI